MIKTQTIKHVARDERGLSLIPVALLIIVIGLLLSSASYIYVLWEDSKGRYSTDDDLATVQNALQDYFALNGRYPCPAPLAAPIDDPAFGLEIGAGDCVAAAAIPNSVFQTAGVDGEQVKIGTVPVRTLGIEDERMFDGYRHRLVYAVTSAYAVAGNLVVDDRGDINIVDSAGNDAMVRPSTVAQVVYSMGGDENGAFDVNGNRISACDGAAVSSENCDFDDATFLNSNEKTRAEGNNQLTTRMQYPVPKTFLTCQDLGLTVPRDVSFIMDTSGSMWWDGGPCPPGIPNFPEGSTCPRVVNAQWAMRSVMLSRMAAVRDLDDPGSTSFSGFAKDRHGRPYGSEGSVDNGLGDIIFDDPDPNDPNYEPPEPNDTLDELNGELAGMCPGGATPLGVHLRVLADRLGASDPDSPNKIIALSDGENTLGEDPASAVAYIRATYPNMKIDIIDVANNPGLAQLAVDNPDTVTYYQTSDPVSLKDSLKQAAGICNRFDPAVNDHPTPCHPSP